MRQTKIRFILFSAAFAASIATVLYAILSLFPELAMAAVQGSSLSDEAIKWGFLGAAITTAASSLGAGIAVSSVGAAAVGVLAEKPDLFGRMLVLVGLAEGIAIYGLIISIMILNKL
jgi:V/A-type H+-transporting ATPase subunit K